MYVLVIFFVLFEVGNPRVGNIFSQEFSSQETCEAALKEFKKYPGVQAIHCVKK